MFRGQVDPLIAVNSVYDNDYNNIDNNNNRDVDNDENENNDNVKTPAAVSASRCSWVSAVIHSIYTQYLYTVSIHSIYTDDPQTST